MSNPDPQILFDATKLPPKEAVDFLRQKGYAISKDWEDVWAAAHQKVFTVAKVMRLDILQDIRGELDTSLSQGTSFQEFKNNLIPMLQSKGWWGKALDEETGDMVQLGSPYRLKTIFDTNMQQAYAAGNWKQIEDVSDARPYVRYVAVLDGATRPAHAALHDKIFAVDDPALRVIGPPNGWNCRCTLASVSDEELARDGISVQPPADVIERDVVIQKTGEVRQVKGVELSDGTKFYPDAGFDYNPGIKDYTPDLGKYDKDLVAEAAKLEPYPLPEISGALEEAADERPLAQRFPVKTNSDVGKLLSVYDKENPGEFNQGFSELKVKATKSFFMGITQKGRVEVSSKTWPSGLNPMRDLKNAMSKIGQGKDLSFHEEYSVEMLWHEIGHVRSTGWQPLTRGGAANMVMEALNQYTARITYPEFLTTLGGKPLHAADVLEKGYGYSKQVKNLRALLRQIGLTDDEAITVLRPINVKTPWSQIPTAMADGLSALKQKPQWKDLILRALARLHLSEAEFQELIKLISEAGA